ncbi:GDP-mannose-dependent alpha-(1-6)-phosphatidylinositol monomannoside mannosyltransferase [Granulosicoccus antarcticus IMCC3135]|uniref:GDP-mannose-dependent alpha-(1-6)-phosphatidylinositol monomannoside mannosyltransferase n=2 Tax=Granulosicoccus TaxID=437504 RepID=A0A2Z2NYA1_9GAMM|nr:GDP-mannose-dependent alpha-(1-6)-phosphatidylinositol monomannoside mannosyltransferase [Granulosicoccus antarcticus IMCC3135]
MDESATKGRPRLGIIISMFPELHETFILRELVALERRGVEFDIYSLQYPRDPITMEDAIRLSTERTHYSPLFTLSTVGALGRAMLHHPLKLGSAIWQLLRHGYDRPMDIVKNLAILPLSLHFGELGRSRGVTHWHGHWANIPTTACWYLNQVEGEPWSAAIHGEDIFSPNTFLRHKLDAALFSVVCSGYFCNHLKTKLGLSAPENVHLNYHGLDPRVMEHAPGKRFRERAAEEVLSLISIGRLVPTKGHDVVIRACAVLIASGRKLRLTLIGSGPIQEELMALAEQEGIREHVDFRGALAFADVLEALDAADLFCLAPRLIPGQPPDGIPNVIAEAMALRLPVVTTRVSAIPELVVDGETGKLVEVDDVQGFAAAVESLAADPEAARLLSEQAAGRVAEMFNQKQNIDDLLALFEQHVPGGLKLPDARRPYS